MNIDDPAEFAFIECYRSMAATASHSKQPHFKTMSKGMQPLIAAKPTMAILQRSKHAGTLDESAGSVVTNTTIQCVAQLKAAAGKEEELEKVLAAAVTPSNAEAGCLMYELFVEPKKPGAFTFIEVWANAESQKQHSRMPHFKAMGRGLKGLLAGAPVVRNYRSISACGCCAKL